MAAETEDKDLRDLPENPLPWGFKQERDDSTQCRYADIVDGNGVYVAQYLNVKSAKTVCMLVNNRQKLMEMVGYFTELVVKHGKLLEEWMTTPGAAQMYDMVAKAREILQRNKQC